MSKKILLFTPAAFNMAETTRMIEIAKGIRNSKGASQAFEIQFISDGGDMEHLIEEEGFPLKRMKPRLAPEKIEHIGKVDKGEKIGPALSRQEMIARMENEVTYLKELHPVAVITGSYMTIPVTCRVLKIPPGVGNPIHLAGGLLCPWRRDDRQYQFPSLQGRCRLDDPVVH